jgi:SAM-dependent methyltransferase
VKPLPLWFAYLTAAVNGAAVMIIEILGAKMLSPYFGTSHFVWTAQIAVTLLALASGYYAGGRIADRSTGARPLYLATAGAAFSLVVTTAACPAVAGGLLALEFSLPAGTIVAALVLFLPALTLLAMTGPIVVRLFSTSVDGVGSQVGRISAVSTFGSLAGTLAIGYVLIPLFFNSTIMYLTAAALAAVALAYFVLWGRKALAITGSALVLASAAGAGSAQLGSERFAGTGGKFHEVFARNSNFGVLQVMENRAGTVRYFLNDRYPQGNYDPIQRIGIMFPINFYYGLMQVYRDLPASRVLFIGLGVGAGPMSFARQGWTVDVVEINGAMAGVSEQWLGVDAGAVNLHIGDGRQFLRTVKGHYDVIVLDAFLGDATPDHLLTVEAFRELRAALTPGGLLLMNANSRHFGKDFFTTALYQTLQAAFPNVQALDRGNQLNYSYVASAGPLTLLREPGLTHVPAGTNERLAATVHRQLSPHDPQAFVLRDDFNPLEVREAANRQELHQLWVDQTADMLRP